MTFLTNCNFDKSEVFFSANTPEQSINPGLDLLKVKKLMDLVNIWVQLRYGSEKDSILKL